MGMASYGYYGAYTSVDFSTKNVHEDNKYPINLDLLKKLLSIQAPSSKEYNMQMFIINWIYKNVPTAELSVDDKGNIFVVKKTSECTVFPSFAAHMDEVNSFQSDRLILEAGNFLFGINRKTGESAGCPGDDRCGCYVCLEMLRLLDNVKVAFFVEEEIGCKGSNACDLTFFADSAFILQVDRRNAVDFITHTNGTSVSNKEFQDAVEPFIKPYGLSFATGTATDIGALVNRGVGCCCANIGSGYYDAHSLKEKVCFTELENIMNMCYNISTSEMGGKRWDFTKPAPVTTTYWGTQNKSGTSAGSEGKVASKCKNCDELYCYACPYYDQSYTVGY